MSRPLRICPHCGAAFEPPHCPYCAQAEIGEEGYATRVPSGGEITTLFQPRLLLDDEEAPELSLREPRLRLLGSEPARFVLLRHEKTVLGRGEADVQVADPAMAQRHFELVRVGDATFVRDLESGPGTFLNDRRVRSSEVLPGDVIRAGTSRFRFEIREE